MAPIEPRAGNQPAKPKTDAVLRGLGWVLLSAFFREIDVTGEDRFPIKGPVVVVANHFNSLIDGALVSSYLPRMPRLLAASIIWKYKPLRPLLTAAGVIPVFRQRDVGTEKSRSQNTLEKTGGLLRAGGVLALFPEGVSHNQPSLMPVKSGAARIALDAEDQHGPLGVTIIPVGLVFDSKSRFRSRALIQIGTPIEISSFAESYQSGDGTARRAAIRKVTGKIEEGLHAVTPNFESWEEARLVGRVADIWAQQEPILPDVLPLADTHQNRHAFGQGYEWMAKHYPDKTARLRTTVIEYDDLLSAAGLRDRQVAASYPPFSVFGFVGRSLFVLGVRLPISIVGTILNWIPYQISKVFALGKDQDKMATWGLFSSLILFPVFWLAQAVICSMVATRWMGLSWGWLIFFAILLAAPMTGPATLTFHDRRRRLIHEIRAWYVLRTRKNLARRLVEMRRDVLRQLTDIVAVYDEESS